MTGSASASDPDRVEALLDRLRVDEKLRLVRGGVDPTGRATGYVPPIDRLGIPACSFTDGPHGVRAGVSVAFPSSLALASAWDPDLAERFGGALADEALAKGFEGVLAPGLNVVRVPHCGRNFEYYSEDPTLTAAVAAATVSGIESRDALAVPKHYLANNQETDRLSVSAAIDERTLRELYLPGVAAAVREGGAGVVMSSYNRVNGTPMTRHGRLLTDVLKDELGFQGAVMSDWWSVRDGAAAAAAGLDLEMPGVTLFDLLRDGDGGLVGPRELRERWPVWLPDGVADAIREAIGAYVAGADGPGLVSMVGASPFARSLPAALARGDLARERLDDMVRRLLRQYERIGLLDADAPRSPASTPSARRRLARAVATRGTVLLKNDGVLPLDADADGDAERIAVVGPAAARAKVGGGGSSAVTPERTISPLDGIERRAGDAVTVEHARGASSGGPATLLSGGYGGSLAVRLGLGAPDLGDAVRAAAAADVAVVAVEDHAAEGTDRDSLRLPGDQDRLIRAVAKTGTPTVVALATAGPVEMPWLDAVDAVVETWYAGQEAGTALARVLFGDADPGGRLPVTFGREARDYPANTPDRYPGVERADGAREAVYAEGVFVGYRHFDARNVEPLFPFGHGESYATFAYRDLDVRVRSAAGSESESESAAVADRDARIEARVTVENVGARPGREVVQAYAAAEGSPRPKPPLELAGFAPVSLNPGETATVTLPLDRRAFATYDPDAGAWRADADAYRVRVGRSSRDHRLAARVAADRFA